MYTLRKITNDNSEMNFYLGENYSVVYAEITPERFNDLISETPYSINECFGVVVDCKSQTHFLFRGQKNFIVNESGRTFARLK